MPNRFTITYWPKPQEGKGKCFIPSSNTQPAYILTSKVDYFALWYLGFIGSSTSLQHVFSFKNLLIVAHVILSKKLYGNELLNVCL